MPRLSDDTLFARALPLAVQDRRSLADCYPPDSPHRAEALEEARALGALRGKRLAQLEATEQPLAYLAFICAQQSEEGLAEANASGDKALQRASLRNARLFQEVRWRRWGKSQLEVALESGRSVGISELLNRESENPKGAT